MDFCGVDRFRYEQGCYLLIRQIRCALVLSTRLKGNQAKMMSQLKSEMVRFSPSTDHFGTELTIVLVNHWRQRQQQQNSARKQQREMVSQWDSVLYWPQSVCSRNIGAALKRAVLAFLALLAFCKFDCVVCALPLLFWTLFSRVYSLVVFPVPITVPLSLCVLVLFISNAPCPNVPLPHVRFPLAWIG